MRYNIYHKNGTKFASTNTIEYNGELMGDRYLNISIDSPYPIQFAVGDYIDYRGERFELVDAVALKKQADKNSYGKGFVYSNIKFDSFINELKHCLFLNITYTNASTNSVGGSLMSKFDFHANNVCDLASRILANLNRVYGNNVWQVKVLGKKNSSDANNAYYNANELLYSVVGESDVEVSISDISVYEALKQAYDTFGVRFVVDKAERIIRICSAGTQVNHVFKYGKGYGLRSIERTVNNDNEIITRLRVIGSEKNMPRHYYYYRELEAKGYNAKVNVTDFTQEGSWFNLPSSVTIKDGDFSMVVNNRTIECEWNTNTDSDKCFAIKYADDNTFVKALYDASKYVTAYINKQYISSCKQSVKVYEGTDDYAPLLAINALMPPDFGIASLNPVYSANEALYGIREAVVRFDADDKDNGIEEVYPSIETSGQNRVAVGSSIEDDGIFDSNVNIPNFTITIHDLGFDLNTTRPDGQSNYGTISFKDGMCGGREFEIVKYNASNHTMTLKRVEDSALNVWFPNHYYPIAENDSFVIYNIEMPSAYVVQAANRLDTLAKAYLAERCYPRYNYNIAIDNIFMARQHDNSTTANSFYWNVKEGDMFNLGADNDIDHSANELIPIDKLVIKESPDNIPQYTINLRNEKKKGTIASVRQDIDKANENANTAIEIANHNKGISADDVTTLINSAMEGLQFSTSGNNLLINSGFVGDYDSTLFAEQDEVTSETEVFSPQLEGWTFKDATANANTNSASGCACVLNGGFIRQQVKVIVGETYIFSLNGSGTFIFSFGGYAEKISLNNERMYYKFIATENEQYFEISGTGTIFELMLERGDIASNEWSKSNFDNNAELARLQSLQYLQNAIQEGATSINGGLVLTNLIELGNFIDGKMQSVTSGLSGIYNDDSDVVFWGGGTLAQAMKAVSLFKSNPKYQPTDAEWASIAKVCITHGGRAILSDIILKGSIYADSGYFKGAVEALSGKLGNLSLNGKLEFDSGNGIKLTIDTSTNRPKIVLSTRNEQSVVTIGAFDISDGNADTYIEIEKGNYKAVLNSFGVSLHDSRYQTELHNGVVDILDKTKRSSLTFAIDENGDYYIEGYDGKNGETRRAQFNTI